MKKQNGGRFPGQVKNPRLLDRYFFLIESVGAELRNKLLEVIQGFDDLYTLIHEFVGMILGRLVLGVAKVFGFVMSPEKPSSPPLRAGLMVLRVVVGVPFLILTFLSTLIVGLLGGTLASALGLRNLGEYSRTEQFAAWSGVLLIGLFLPALFGSYVLYRLSLCCIFTIIVLGLNVLYGQCGVITIGHAAFVLVGAFTTTLLYNGCLGYAFPFLISLILASCLAGCLSYIIGFPSLRVKDHYLTVITLAFTIAIPQIIRSHYISNLAGGSQEGLSINKIPPPAFLSHMSESTWAYYFIFLSAFIFVVAAYNLQVNSQIGRAFRLIKCDDVVARAQGIDVAKYKLLAFVLSAFYGAFAGGLMMMISNYISSESYSVFDSIDYFIGISIGGPASILGSILGGTFLAFESDMTKAIASFVYRGQNLMRMAEGFILIIMICFFPDGLAGSMRHWAKRLVSKKPRRGTHYMIPPPDYDIVSAKDYRDIKERRQA